MATINRRITAAAEVTALAAEPEGETLDYKGKVDTSQWWELAKDIAAFANHLGGVLIVGAFERPDGLPELRGLAPEECAATAQAYDMAARDKCRPSLLVTWTRIPWNDGREILAVNVTASQGFVGAQFFAPNRNGAPEPANVWQFPMRVGKDNVPLPLEQAIMHMSSHARRIAILLAAVGLETPVKLSLRRRKELHVPWKGRLMSFSVADNAALVRLTPEGGEEQIKDHAIPLDDIESVWREAGTWYVRISGFFEQWSGADGKYLTEYFSRPRGEQTS